MNIIQNIQKHLSDDLANIDSTILTHLAAEEDLINVVGRYLIEAKGKRIRPLLTILSSKTFGYNGVEHIKLATAVEFIHAATLLHDDVIDDSTMRRFKPAANIVWGSKVSILVGDFLLSQAFKLMVATNSVPAMQSLSCAAAIIAEGEVSQLVKLQQKRLLTESEYTKVIAAKTAELFASACEVGAIIAGQSATNCKILWNFGFTLGHIFQITDDWLDYFGNELDTGKNLADDFLEGKATLPLIILNNHLTASTQKKISELIQSESRSQEDFQFVKNLLEEYDIRKKLLQYIKDLALKAISYSKQIPTDNKYKDYLLEIIEFTINRTS